LYVVVQNVVNGIAANRYTFSDHLGSLVAVANETGALIEGGGFNAFGERRANDSATSITQTGYASTTRGYTGHEMLDGLDVIHMNGRIYDPTLGRFLQPDPIIQSPGNPQNWNAYSYVFNNPYKYTDPTGYLGQTERQLVAVVVAIVAAIFQQYYISEGMLSAAFAVTVAGGFASGAIATKSFQGGLYGAFGAALTFGVGQYMAGADLGARMFAQAVTGGIVESLQGGNFGAGFVTAWVGAAVAPGLRNLGTVKRVVVAAIVGGTLSEITGGKFANGAVSWAVSAAMSAGQENRSASLKSTEDNGFGKFETEEPQALKDLKIKYPGISKRMDSKWAASFAGFFREEYGFIALENPSGTEMRYVNLESEWSWNPKSLGYKRISFRNIGEKLSAAGIPDDWIVRFVFHTHPFDRCYNICGPSSSGLGPSRGDQDVASKLPDAFHVVREIQGLRYEDDGKYQDLYFGQSAFKP
jgi:RHS repeat-associated protein